MVKQWPRDPRYYISYNIYMIGTLNVWKLLLFIASILVFTIVLYSGKIKLLNNLLSIQDGPTKNNDLLKTMISILVFIGIINTFATTNNDELKLLILLLIIIINNIININYSIQNCKYPNIYKFRLHLRGIFIIVLIYFIMRYTNRNGIVDFLYDNTINTRSIQQTITLQDCPDMSDYNFRKNDKWTGLSKDKQEKCLDELQRRDFITDRIYS
jgi:hypothetical protein